MKITFIIFVSLIAVVCLHLIFISITAKSVKAGLIEGKLDPCGGKPNCVNSEYEGDNYISPIILQRTAVAEQWESIRDAVVAAGGKIAEYREDYMWVEFQSPVFRFVDDLELRIDKDENVLHIRSEARSGTLDFGVNRKRIEGLRSKLE